MTDACERVRPLTSGTVALLPLVVVAAGSVVVGDGPLETTIVTVEPLLALAPPGGLVLMTVPACAASDAWVLVLTLKPAWPRMLPAFAASWPTTLGTVAWPVPLDTVRVTEEFLA